jgi:hypothetical protein
MPPAPFQFDITTRRGRERSREVWTGIKVADCTEAQITAAAAAGYEADGEYFVGRDPRRMSQDELRAMEHEPMSPMEAIRAKCLDCCAGSADEVRKCVAMTCPSWPYRMGKNPWRDVSEAQREAGRRLAAQRAQKSSDASYNLDKNDESDADELLTVVPPYLHAGEGCCFLACLGDLPVHLLRA